ncbi:MAG TPA: hypothetical protein VMM16_05370 [Verrucomicrobiae bacterium]|nr:hypothetical protein [Verrucomicrobiae bacterium]
MEQEQHHHLVFENAYVRVFYVEIAAHESTLYHRHAFPYLSLAPPAMPDAPAQAGGPNEQTASSVAPVSYAPGGFSHAVHNTRDITLRNIAVELLRPQGELRNRCQQIVREQPQHNCVDLKERDPDSGRLLSSVETLFETDEISVREWEVWPNVTVTPAAQSRSSTLVGSMSGVVNVTANGDSRLVPQAGVVWLLAGSRTALRTGPNAHGRFIAVVFKDSDSAQASQ